MVPIVAPVWNPSEAICLPLAQGLHRRKATAAMQNRRHDKNSDGGKHLDADGIETGKFKIPASGRRHRALELLVNLLRQSLRSDCVSVLIV
jgi:hypothetical protein